MAKRKPHARSSSSGSSPKSDALPRFMTVLVKATELFEQDVQERGWGGNAALLQEIQKARAFYTQAAHASLRPAKRLGPCSVVEIQEVSWLGNQATPWAPERRAPAGPTAPRAR